MGNFDATIKFRHGQLINWEAKIKSNELLLKIDFASE